ncbi:tRNA pseudouridine(38-40) synthase TruA [Borrelia sp. MN22-0132]|uniref:tRNA pseudouridine(38-40) synthase TruA n=1 Tax=Borrelia sp. MN22-0132 TaxID=3085635 RepID=UPI003B9E7914
MKKVLAEITYDGSPYYGFQIQPKKPTIQGEIEKVLEKISKTKIKIHSAGRTDKGVHARGQIISFYIKINIKLKKLKTAINSLLKDDIRIIKLKYVEDKFQPRFDAKGRKYSYYILNNEKHYPWEGYQAYYVKKKLNINRLNEMAKMLIGIHDFTTFACKRDQTNSKLKEIYSARFKKKNKFIIFEIIGSSFLWKMVRSIVGAMIDIEIKNEPVDTFKKILNSKNRKFTRKTAPAKALFLDKVFYE